MSSSEEEFSGFEDVHLSSSAVRPSKSLQDFTSFRVALEATNKELEVTNKELEVTNKELAEVKADFQLITARVKMLEDTVKRDREVELVSIILLL